MKNPYDCLVCDNEDCTGCGERAYEEGWEDALISEEFKEAACEYCRDEGWTEPQ